MLKSRNILLKNHTNTSKTLTEVNSPKNHHTPSRNNLTPNRNYHAPHQNFFTSHPFFLAFCLFFIVVVTILLIYLHSLNSLATLDLLVTPQSATITINDKIYTNGIYQLEPGNYHATITKENFETKEFDLELKANKTTPLHTYLTQTDHTYSWYLEHNEDDLILNTIGDESAATAAEIYNSKYPIITSLPIIYSQYDDSYQLIDYRIDGGTFDSCSSDFCLQITYIDDPSRSAALATLQEKGYNINDYEIIYNHKPIQQL